MQEVRELGWLPRDRTQTERRLAKAFSKARAAGYMDAYESELESFAARGRELPAAVLPSPAAFAAEQRQPDMEAADSAAELSAEVSTAASAATPAAEQRKREVPASVFASLAAFAAEQHRPEMGVMKAIKAKKQDICLFKLGFWRADGRAKAPSWGFDAPIGVPKFQGGVWARRSARQNPKLEQTDVLLLSLDGLHGLHCWRWSRHL